MNSTSVQFVREFIATSDIEPAILRSLLSRFEPKWIKRILWLTRSKYLVICALPLEVTDNSIRTDTLVELSKMAAREIEQFGRTVAVILDKDWSVSALSDRQGWILTNDGNVQTLKAKNPFTIIGPSVPITFQTCAMDILAKRPIGVRLFFDGKNSKSSAKSVTEYFRVIEAGFSLRGSRLSKPLLEFLSTGEFLVSQNKWAETKALRDQLSHAYQTEQTLFETDATPHVSLFQNIAADVLVNKKIWGSKDTQRHEENFMATYINPCGDVTVTHGYPFAMQIRCLDASSGVPSLMDVETIKENYSRYARFLGDCIFDKPAQQLVQ